MPGDPISNKALNLTLTDGTATAGSDYRADGATSISLTTFGASTRRAFRIRILGDNVHEPTETFTATLSHGAGASNSDFTIGSASRITFTIRDDDPASTDATLSALALSVGSLSPVFAAATLTYSASVAGDVSNIKVTPTANHAGARITVAGSAVASGAASGNVALTAGGTTAIAVVVTAQDGSTTKTYTINVARADLPVVVVKIRAGHSGSQRDRRHTETKARRVAQRRETLQRGHRSQNERRNRNRRARLHSPR